MENLKNAPLENANENSQAKTTSSTSTKSKSYYKPVPDFINESEVTLTNAQDSEILPLIEKRGYTKTIIVGKLAEFETLSQYDQKQYKEYGDKLKATEDYNNAVEILDDEYADHILLARRVFKKDTAAKETLGLKGDRKASKSGYAEQAKKFYDGVLNNPEYIAAIAKKGVTDVDLKSQQAGYDKLVDLEAIKDDESSEAQTATKLRDALHDALHEWMAEFKETAIIALKKKPQLREKLGYIEN